MPRGTKSSKITRLKELAGSLTILATEMQEEYDRAFADSETLKALKPALTTLTKAITPKDTTPADGQEVPWTDDGRDNQGGDPPAMTEPPGLPDSPMEKPKRSRKSKYGATDDLSQSREEKPDQ